MSSKVHFNGSVDHDILEQAQSLRYPDGTPFNLSGEFENFLKIKINQLRGTPTDLTSELDAAKAKVAELEAGVELTKPKTWPDAVVKDLDVWVSGLKLNKEHLLNWRKFIPGNIRRIKHVHGVDMTQFELEAEIQRRLNG